MSSALDMSPDDIIKSNKPSFRGKGGRGSSHGPARHSSKRGANRTAPYSKLVQASVATLQHDMFVDGAPAYTSQSTRSSSIETGAKLYISNLDYGVSNEDIKELRVAASNIEPKHEKEIVSLVNSYKSLYSRWVFDLRCGFGLLMYGFGSKRALLEDFASTALTEYSVIVINGYLQSINMKQVVVTLAEVLWDQFKSKRKTGSRNLPKAQQPFNSRSMEDLLAFLDGLEVKENDCFVCVVIHNIDGPGLRDSETQQFLAQIASCSHIRMVASVDHVNAPLLWDKKMVHTQFNWHWYHVPTFAPYNVEGMFFPLILAHSGSAQSAKTAAIVLQSLTPNAQSVFKILAEYQLSHDDEQGMPVDNLYATARERFLVSSQVTLNSHLTEFKDHELVKTRRHSDGQDCLYIPFASEALEKLLSEMNL